MTIKTGQPKEEEYLYSHMRYSLWRTFDLISSSFAIFGLITSTIDYEVSYPLDRTKYECLSNELQTENFRLATALTTVASIIFSICCNYEKIEWYKSIRSLERTSHTDFDFNEFLVRLKFNACCEVLFLCIFTYPYMDYQIYIPLRYNFNTITLCYKLSEFLYCIMFFRFYFLLRSLTSFSVFNDERVRIYCLQNDIKPGFVFVVKCVLVTHPIYTVFTIGISSMLFTAIACRVFERPMDRSTELYYSNPLNDIWFIFETISTLGYGDLFPVTYFGRVVALAAWFIESIVLSIAIAVMQRNADLNKDEGECFSKITNFNGAFDVIKASLRYHLSKKSGEKANQKYIELKKSANKFKAIRMSFKKMDYLNKKVKEQAVAEADEVRLQIKNCSRTLDRLIAQYSSG